MYVCAGSPVHLLDQILKIIFCHCCHLVQRKWFGMATPKEPSEHWKDAWDFSTGDELKLMIAWDSSNINIQP